MCEVTPYYGKRSHKVWYITYIPQFAVVYQLYTTAQRF